MTVCQITGNGARQDGGMVTRSKFRVRLGGEMDEQGEEHSKQGAGSLEGAERLETFDSGYVRGRNVVPTWVSIRQTAP